ncbi:MAG: hypothetical protein AAGA54_11555 [Myxococcota bacterium]
MPRPSCFAALIVLASCSSTPAPAAVTPEAVAPSEAPAATPEPPSRFVLAGANGVQRLAPDGTMTEQLSSTAAVAVRWVPDADTLVFVDANANLVSLEGSNERVLAPLPVALPCTSDEFVEPTLGLHMDEDFWITADGTHACLSLSDAFPNMRNVERQVAVRLSDGAVQQQLFLGGEACGQPDANATLDVCAGRTFRTPPEVESPLPGGGMVDSTSPDGAWTLVQVGSELADVSHIQYVLVRNIDGLVFPTPYQAGAWPEAIALPDVLQPDTLVAELPDVQGGETVTWVGPHHLVLDQILYVAGERIVPLDGDVAPLI